MKIKRLNHEEHEEHEGKATKKSIMNLPFFCPVALSERASLVEALLRVLRGSIFGSGSAGAEVTA
ncbi:MAG TPA: hypothetical protein VGH81_06130 [Rudaea sp.]|jgi:hypothetical protein